MIPKREILWPQGNPNFDGFPMFCGLALQTEGLPKASKVCSMVRVWNHVQQSEAGDLGILKMHFRHFPLPDAEKRHDSEYSHQTNSFDRVLGL